MSYTNTELVRHHLVASFPVQGQVYDQAIVLEGDDYITFFGGAVDEVSLVVKSIQNNEPTRLNLTLSSEVTALPTSPIVRGSIVVASDSSLGTIYTENGDYVIDYFGGAIRIKGGGNLSVGQTVTVWYLAYFLYLQGSDYRIDSSRGAIRRVSSGDIVSGETVYLDYAPVNADYTDAILTHAVVEANGLIESAVDPQRQFGADPVLQTAATYRALEIVCRASAARELSRLTGDDKTALAWMKLADHYSQRSDQLLGSFRPPCSSPTSPTHS